MACLIPLTADRFSAVADRPPSRQDRAAASLERLCAREDIEDVLAVVCGEDGRHYRNPCEASDAGTKVKQLHTCRPGMKTHRPSIAQVLRHLRNNLKSAKETQGLFEENLFTELAERVQQVKGLRDRFTIGQMSNGARSCQAAIHTVCASNGRTYWNPCEVPDGLRIRSEGPCGL